jgi:Dyp-type peroxidase family
MPAIESVLKSAQPGLMFTPTHGLFITGWLKEPHASKPILAALKLLVTPADTRSDRRRIVVAIRGALWNEWSGHAPVGAPPSRSVLATSSHFQDSGGDVWLYLKADSEAGVDVLRASVEKSLGPLLSRHEQTRASMPPDQKILDQHFIDGITSPSDPASVVENILQTGTNTAPGSCWVLAQKFDVAWAAFSGMSLHAQQNVIGRDDQAVLIPDQDIRSHIKRVRVLAEDHSNRELVRQALPYGHSPLGGGREQGIYFVGFAKDTAVFETMLARMVGGPSGNSDKLLGILNAVSGGYFYVPSTSELDVRQGLTPSDFVPAPLWRVRSDNGLMFYNSADYLHVMGTGQYVLGDAPSQRILGLLGKVFERWQNQWYRRMDTPRVPPLSAFLDRGEQHYLKAPVVVRRGLSIQRMLTRVWTTTEYPLPRDSWAWQADLFRIDPQDVLVGVMPELSLGRGKEVMPYLDDEERLEGFLALLDETSSMGHVVPNHRKVLELGLEALLKDLRKREKKASTDDQRAFFQAAILSLEGVQGYCLNYALLAERMAADASTHPEARENLRTLAARMRKLATDKPDTLVEAAQGLFNLHCCLHLVGEPVSIGRLDQLLAPFFDPNQEEEAQEVLDALWVKLGEKALHNRQNATDHATYGTTAVSYAGGNFPQGDGINQWVQQITVGGYLPTDDAKPTPGANRLTLLSLRSARRLPLNAPVLSLRVYPGLGEDIIQEAARALLSGGSHPILFQEDRMVAALSGFSKLPLSAARDYVCDGCYEPMIAGQCEFAFSNIVTLDALELALNQGARFNQAGPVYLRGWKLSFRSPPASEISSFEQLQTLYLQHLRYLTVQFYTSVLNNYGALWNYCPSPLLSTVIDGCVETGRDLSNGGARYHLIAPMYLALSTTIDSLYAIKKLVFDQETALTTLPELVEALQEDWGHGMEEPFQSQLAGKLRSEERARRFQQLRAAALALPKFGMGVPEVDALGGWLVDRITTLARETLDSPPPVLAKILQGLKKTYSVRGAPWELSLQVGVGTFEAYVGDALSSGASPNGRRNAQPYPSDFSPTPVPQDLPPIAQDPSASNPFAGTNRPLYTAMSSWNQDAINLKLSNAAPVDLNVREDFPQEELEEFIRQYAAGHVGSNLLTVTVADPDTYAAAAGQPERYELVRVRTGGWTEFFSAMFPAHHAQHQRRPYFVPQAPPRGRLGSKGRPKRR